MLARYNVPFKALIIPNNMLWSPFSELQNIFNLLYAIGLFLYPLKTGVEKETSGMK